MLENTAHVDQFARNNLPPAAQWPEFSFDLPELQYPQQLNCAVELLDWHVENGDGDRTVFLTPNATWTYSKLQAATNRIAHVLTEDADMAPGNRVMLRSANNPMAIAVWFAVIKAGGIAVTTMQLLRAGEIGEILDKAEVGLAVCDQHLAAEMNKATDGNRFCRRVLQFNGSGQGDGAELERLMADKPATFEAVRTSRDDVAMIAPTSGTTGKAKATMHFHRDVMAVCDCFPRSIMQVQADDIFVGSPPIAFTFGLGGEVLFPMRFGAASVLLEAAPPSVLLEAIERFGVTTCFTAPTAYKRMLSDMRPGSLDSLHTCVSAGEHLPKPVSDAWYDATGIRIIDGIGSTEMLHIFISAAGDDIRPGSTGRAIPGYEARIVDDGMNPLPPGEIGRLAVRGPTGCRYLADERQDVYVRDGWNLTGDAYWQDEDGYFWFHSRTDDMIVSSGYNISGPEVEEALLDHPAVAETAVVGVPDEARGMLVKAAVVLNAGVEPSGETAAMLQDHVKQTIAPYKYPRVVEFMEALPRTETGKVQRFRLTERV